MGLSSKSTGGTYSAGWRPLAATLALWGTFPSLKDAWVQLCYSVAYWMLQRKARAKELSKPPCVSRQPCPGLHKQRWYEVPQVPRDSPPHRTGHEMSNHGSDELIFDEYLIHGLLGWLWFDIGTFPTKTLGALGWTQCARRIRGSSVSDVFRERKDLFRMRNTKPYSSRFKT